MSDARAAQRCSVGENNSSRQRGVQMFSGFLRGWLMETNVSLSQRHLGLSSDGVRTTQSIGLCQPCLAWAALAGQHCGWQAPCWQMSPCMSPPHPGLASKIINVSYALNNVDKPILYTSSVRESSGQAKGRKVRRCHHHKAAQSQALCHEVVHPAQGHAATPKPGGCKGWHLWAEAGDSEKSKCHMPLGKPLSNNMKSHQKQIEFPWEI